MNNSNKVFSDDTSFQEDFRFYDNDLDESFNLICFKTGRFNLNGKKIYCNHSDTWGDSGSTLTLNYEGSYNIIKEDSNILLVTLQTDKMSCLKKNFGYDSDESNVNRQESKTITFYSFKWANKHSFSKEINIPEQFEWSFIFNKMIFDEESLIQKSLEQLGLDEINDQAINLLKKNHGEIEKTFYELYPEVLEKKNLILEAIPKKFHPDCRYRDYLREMNLFILKANFNLIKALNNLDSYTYGKLVNYEEWCKKNIGLIDQIEIIKLYYSSYYLYEEVIDPERFPNRKILLQDKFLNLVSYYNLNIPYGDYTEEKIIDRMFYHYNQNENFEKCLIYEMTGDKVLAFRKFINKFTDDDIRRRAAFACKHFTPNETYKFKQALFDNLEIIISDMVFYESFKYLFILLLNSDFNGYHQLTDFLKSYLESNNILEVAFEKCCYVDTFEKYTKEFNYPLTKEQYILATNSRYEWTEHEIKYLTDDFNIFTKKNLSIKQSIEMLSEISLNKDLHYSQHDKEEEKKKKIFAIDNYYFNTRKIYLEKAKDLKLKYQTTCKLSSNIPFYLLIKYSGDFKQVEDYLSDIV